MKREICKWHWRRWEREYLDKRFSEGDPLGQDELMAVDPEKLVNWDDVVFRIGLNNKINLLV